MRIERFSKNIVVTAERGMYLSFVDEDLSADKVGMPERIIFSNLGKVPEFKEVPLGNIKEERSEEITDKKSAKSRRKKSDK